MIRGKVSSYCPWGLHLCMYLYICLISHWVEPSRQQIGVCLRNGDDCYDYLFISKVFKKPLF